MLDQYLLNPAHRNLYQALLPTRFLFKEALLIFFVYFVPFVVK